MKVILYHIPYHVIEIIEQGLDLGERAGFTCILSKRTPFETRGMDVGGRQCEGGDDTSAFIRVIYVNRNWMTIL